MTSIEVSLIAFVVHSVTVIVLLKLIRDAALFKPSRDKFREVQEILGEVDSIMSKLFIVLYLIAPYFFRSGAYAFLSGYAVAGFAAIGHMANLWDLVEIQQILLDFYDFIEKTLLVILNN